MKPSELTFDKLRFEFGEQGTFGVAGAIDAHIRAVIEESQPVHLSDGQDISAAYFCALETVARGQLFVVDSDVYDKAIAHLRKVWLPHQ